jgi:hypothetical protein
MNNSDTSRQSQLHDLAMLKARLEIAEAEHKVQEANLRMLAAKEHLEEATAERLSSQMLNLPHRVLPLKIYNDGVEWIAMYTCPEGEPLVGRGDNPQLALANFDHQWLGLR